MYEGFHIGSFLLGLPLGLAVTGVILLFSRRTGKKERRFDERYTTIHRNARSISWGVMTAVILIAWIIVMFIERPSLAFFIITAIWVAHMLSYGVAAFIEDNKN